MEGHCETIVESLRANNAILFGVHNEATQARVSWVLCIELGKELLVVDSHSARDIIFTLKSGNLANHRGFVLLNSLVNDTRQNVHIALSATKSDLWLNEFDETLNEQILQQVGILLLIVGEALSHLDTSLGLQALNELVGTLHAIDTSFVLCLGFLNFKVALGNLQVLEHLITQALLLSLDHFL